MCNTEQSTNEQGIGKDNPYWSASYGDVCEMVRREMGLRAEVERLKLLTGKPLMGIDYRTLESENAMLKAEIAKLRPTVKTSKKKRPFVPLSEHAKTRLAVLRYVGQRFPLVGATSSECARFTGQNTNNCAKRIQELTFEGYLSASGEYRQSLDSAKMLTVYVRTAKQYVGGER